MFANRYGLNALLKDGYKTFTGVDEVTTKNVEACRTVSDIVKTSLGPNAQSKLIVTSLARRFVTSDGASILKELEVQHPAAKMMLMAVEMQKREMGGGCTFLLAFCGQLLNHAVLLLREGLHGADIVKGYEIAAAKTPQILENNTKFSCINLKDVDTLHMLLRTHLGGKPLCAQNLASLAARAIDAVTPPNQKDFDPENIRVLKLAGGRMDMSALFNGIIVGRPPTGSVEEKKDCKVMVLGCGLEAASTEAKGTVLLRSAAELANFTKGEEALMDKIIRNIKDAGVDAIVVHGGPISDVGQHFCDKYQILTIKVQSKFEARRLCKALGATAMVRVGTPTAEELGVATSIITTEIASQRVTQILCRDTRVQTIVLRGATPCLLDEGEKAVEDATAFAKALTKDPRFVCGAGAIEMEIAKELAQHGATISGLEKHAVIKAAEAFEIIPEILAHNAGHNSSEVVATLRAKHAAGNAYSGVCANAEEVQHKLGVKMSICDTQNTQIFDHLLTKMWAIRLAFDAAITILRVDQIIMARPAGGPAPRAPQAPDLD